VIGKVPVERFPDRRDVSTVRSVSSTREAEIMKKMRKGIVMLAVAASAAVGVAASASSAQAATVTPTTTIVVTVKTAPPVPNSFGSVWM
jgi:hypothetical protein